GTIDRVGAGVPQARLGERVWVFAAQHGRPFGTAAEYTCVPARFAVRLPDGASFADGACLGVPAVTAHRCLFADGPVRGLAVLVSGGAGRVGAYAVRMAKRAGALTIATASTPKLAQVKDLGADVALDYRAPDLAAKIRAATGGKGVDRVVDAAFGANIALSPKILAPNGVIASYASDGVPEPNIPFGPLMVLNATLRLVFIYGMPESAQDAAFADITEMLGVGALKHRIGARFPLARLASAHDAVERGTATGSVLVDI
ncbi:MAG: NADPH:quinone reductase, partial [Rhodospirillales bacterium]|nr:NADPH:quinone reductase [Rhodospirillales bacterium]